MSNVSQLDNILSRRINQLVVCGASLNHTGNKTCSINQTEDEVVIKSLLAKLDSIIQ